MVIKVKDKEIKMKYSFRSMMIYEKIAGSSFAPKGITEILIYFYSTILASDKDSTLTFEEFMEWIDEHPKELNDFSTWLTETLTKNSVINEGVEGEGDKSGKKK